MHQRTDSGKQPLSFFSVKLNSAQQKYSAFDRELLTCYIGIRHFCWLLEGRSFYILTAQKPLTFVLQLVSDHWSARQQRYFSYISEFTADLHHVESKDNMVLDALSRPAAAVALAPRREVYFWHWPQRNKVAAKFGNAEQPLTGSAEGGSGRSGLIV